MIRAVFYGTPAEAVPALAALCTRAEVPLVVTQPDRARGRSKRPQPSPVKLAAESWGLRVVQPERAADVLDVVRATAPDVAVVVAYGQLLKPSLLEIPRRGFVNVHFSLLPRWRGASPVVRTILAGDEETGVTLMQVDAGLDTGPVLAVESTPLRPAETAGELTARLAAMGAAVLADRLEAIVGGEVDPVPQREEAATAAAKVQVTEAYVDPRRHSAEAVLRAVRAFDPRPGAWSTVEGSRIKLWRAAPAGEPVEPGSAELRERRVLLGTPDGSVELLEVQPAGRARMAAVDWMRGRRGVSARFGTG